MKDMSGAWVLAGIKALSKHGKIEVNSLCKEMGKAKSSFYNIYPNYENSRGMDRFEDDLLKHHETILMEFFHQMGKIYIVYEIPEMVSEISLKIKEYYDYHRCSAHFRKMAQINKKIKEYWDKIYQEYMKVIGQFYKLYKLENNKKADDIELRLFLDSVLYYKDEEFLEDANNINWDRFKRRKSEKI